MSGLEITGSVFAVVTVGLQCSKCIYEIVRGIKGGPSAVRKLVTATKNLANLLEQLREFAVNAKDILGEEDAKFSDDLKNLLFECVEELTVVEEKLKRFTASSDHRLWYNLKSHLHEKEFEMIWSRIDYYVQFFTLQLSCAGA